MVKFNADILSSPCVNSNNFPLSLINEYSKLSRLCKSVVSKPKAKCFAAIENFESVKITFVQSDSFFISFQFSISEIQITPIPRNILPSINISFASFKPFAVIKITFVSSLIEELNKRLSAINLYLYFLNKIIIYYEYLDQLFKH